MDTVSRKTLLGLLNHPTATCVSIYMPTHPTGSEGWGNVLSDRTLEVHQSHEIGDDDLLDLAAAQTLLHRGTVYSLDIEQLPNHRIAAALFRY